MNQAALHNNKLLEKEHDNAERGAALVGATGAVVGTAMEHAMANGLPKDEWLVYEDACGEGKRWSSRCRTTRPGGRRPRGLG